MRLTGPLSALALARLTSILVSFIMTPIALTYLGEAKYGLWMALASAIMVLASVADGGISNGVISQTAKCKTDEQRSIILSTATIIITGFAVVLAFFTLPLAYILKWDQLLNLGSDATVLDAKIIFLIVVVAFTISMPVNIFLKFRMGLQKFIGVGLWDTAAILCVIPAIISVTLFDLGLDFFVSGVLLTPLLIKAMGSFIYLSRQRHYRIKLSYFRWGAGKRLLSAGLVFVFISVSQAIAINSDQILIAALSNVNEVTPYSILNRLFTLPYIGINLLLTVLWPMFAKQWANDNYQWVRKTFWTTLVLASGVATLGALGLYFSNAYILQIWINRTFDQYPLLILGMATYAPILVFVGVTSTLLVSLEFHKPQIYMNVAMMVINLPLSIYLIPKIGAAGAIWATNFSYVVCILLPSVILIPRLLWSKDDVISTKH